MKYPDMKLDKLESDIGYHFNDISLLQHALIHPSYSNEQGDPKECSNQRLEFLGDAVLELASSVVLYAIRPYMQEGDLTKKRAALVCEPTLAVAARKINLSKYIALGVGEAKEGINIKDSVSSDAFEAVIGAIYLDGGFEPAKAFVDKFVMTEIDAAELYKDAKSSLQELVATRKQTLDYNLLSVSGPDHERIFEVSCLIDDKEYSRGSGSSKKKAEQDAAYNALKLLKGGN